MRKNIISVISVLISLLIISSITVSTISVMQHTIYANPLLSITLKTNNPSYYLRENVDIYGNLTSDGTPVSNGLVAIEVLDPINSPLVYRTLPTDDVTVNGFIEIEVIPCDEYLNPVDSFKLEPYSITKAYFEMVVRNTDTKTHAVALCLCVYDGNMIALGTDKHGPATVLPGESYTRLYVELPHWAYIGDAKAIGNAYTELPKNGGVPYCLEKLASFKITRNPEIEGSGTQSYSPSQEVEGTYNTTFKLSPEPRPGTYAIYANARRTDSLLHKAEESTTFGVKSTSSPPQASFTYTPLEPYVNMTITFDASGSTAEGYNDTIVRYEWNFDDGTPLDVKTTPTTNHVFKQVGTYTVTLNVTDSEGLWCTTSKPITILPPTGPTAAFIWYPSLPLTNQAVTFDASSSEPGWNGTASPPIVSYEWDFGDLNVTTVTNPVIEHTYTTEGNYSVTLTITDADGLQSNKTQTVMVSEVSPLIGDVNGDGVVDMMDVSLACYAAFTIPGHPRWDPRCDVDQNGIVDMMDISIICYHFLEHI